MFIRRMSATEQDITTEDPGCNNVREIFCICHGIVGKGFATLSY